MAEVNSSADISIRHFPGDEEPTPAAAWVSLATVLIFLAAAVLYSLHLAAPDDQEEYKDFLAAHPPKTAEGELAAARFCARRPSLEAKYEMHLRNAWKAAPTLPGLQSELHRLWERRHEGVASASDHDALALWCRELGMEEEARQEYDAALGIDPNDAEAKRGLSELRK